MMLSPRTIRRPAATQTISAAGWTLTHNHRPQINVSCSGAYAWQGDTIQAGNYEGQALQVVVVSSPLEANVLQVNPGGNIVLWRDTPWTGKQPWHFLKLRWNAATSRWVEVGRDFYPTQPGKVHQYVRRGNVLWIEPCDAIAAFSSSGGTRSLNTTDCYCGNVASGSVQLTGTGTTTERYLSRSWDADKDLSNAWIHLRFYIHPGEGTADFDNLVNPFFDFTIYDSISGISGNNVRRRCWSYSYHLTPRAGWYSISFPISAMSVNGIGITPTAARHIRLALGHNSAEFTGAFTLDRVAFASSPLASGYFAVRVDSPVSFAQVQNLAAYSNSLGVPLSISFNPRVIDQALRPTIAQLRGFQAHGHEIIHYPADEIWSSWGDKTLYQKEAVLAYGQRYFRENGLREDGAKIINRSGGSWWTPADQLTLKPTYLLCSSGEGPGGYLDAANKMPAATLWDPSQLDWAWFVNGETAVVPTNLATNITGCVNDKALFVLGGHNRYDAEVSTLKSIIDSLITAGLKPCTLGQVARGEIS